jgi:hypothetical protein
MRRQDLEHLIRVSSDITEEYELVVVGSQAILGTDPNPPAALTVSVEADIYPLNRPELADKIDVMIGEGSPFHEQHGYYAQGVGAETAKLPVGWMDRIVRVPHAAYNAGVGYCISVIDLFMSKAAAGREKDQEFCMALLEHGYLRVSAALALVASMPEEVDKRQLTARIRRWIKSARDAGQVIPDE